MSGLMSMAPPPSAAPTAPAAPAPNNGAAPATPRFQQGPTPPPPGVGAAPAQQFQQPTQASIPAQQFQQPTQAPAPAQQFQQQLQAPAQYQQPAQQPEYAQQQPQAPTRPFFDTFAAEQPQQAQAPQQLDPSALAAQVAQHLGAQQQQPASAYTVPVSNDVDVSAWDQHRPALNRLIAEAINEHVAPHLGQIAGQNNVEAIRSDLDGLRDQTYQSSLRAAVPGLDDIANTPEFQQYRNTVLPGGVTVDALMRSAHQSRNAGAMIDVFRGFQQANAGHNPMQPMSAQPATNGFNQQAQQFTQPHVAAGASMYPGAGPQAGISPQAAAEVLDRYARGQATREEYEAVESALMQQQAAQPAR